MKNDTERNAIFISHATPEDNAFVRWLGAKLTSLGYEVWADVMRLRGGADWARDLEEALRLRSAKMLLVCTPSSLDKQGVRNEIEMAVGLARQLGDREFIIPLRLEPYESPFRIAQAQYVDFKGSWATGFSELAELLSQFPSLRKTQGRSVEAWLGAQRIGSTRLAEKREHLVSNWLVFSSLPKKIFYCEPPVGFQVERFQRRELHRWPAVPFRAGVLAIASPDKEGMLGTQLPAKVAGEMAMDRFLEEGWEAIQITQYEARRIFSDLGNQAFEAFLNKRNLSFSEASSGHRLWYGSVKTVPLNRISFDWKHRKGSRQIIGQSEKRGTFWHYAMSGRMRTSPVRHLKLSASLVFSDNGMDALGDPKKAHRLRRSFAKSWRNARWRDMMLAFLWWLSSGKEKLVIPIAENDALILNLPPASFVSSVGVLHEGEELADEDDPDIDDEDWDDYSGSLDEGAGER